MVPQILVLICSEENRILIPRVSVNNMNNRLTAEPHDIYRQVLIEDDKIRRDLFCR